MEKREIISRIIKAAREYDKVLCGKELLFVFGDPQNPKSVIATFRREAFQHLVGVDIDKKHCSSSQFYELCLDNELSADVISTKDWTKQKITVIDNVLHIEKTAKMTGEYDQNTGFNLYTERLIGGQAACMGFVKVGNRYIPNTVLEKDIRRITVDSPKRILLIAKKSEGATNFDISYIAKGLTLKDINVKEDLKELFSQDLFSDDKEETSEILKDGFVPTDRSEYYDRLSEPRSRTITRSQTDDRDM